MSAHANRAIAKKARLERMERDIKDAGNYTFIQMNSDEFLDFYVHVQLKKGKTRIQIADELRILLETNNTPSIDYTQIYNWVKKITFQVPLIDDAKTLIILANELSKSGKILSKYKVKVYAGSPTIIMRSTPSLKSHLTGTLYLAKNPKIFTVGLGYLAAQKALKGGIVFTLIASPVFRYIDLLFDDSLTWRHVVSGIAVDLTIALASVAAAATALAIGSVVVGTTIAAVPLLIVLMVGSLFSISATFIFDEELNELVKNMAMYILSKEKELYYKLNQVAFISPEKHPEAVRLKRLKNFFGIPDFSDLF